MIARRKSRGPRTNAWSPSQFCGGAVTCTTGGAGDPDSGACTYKHPLLDAGTRFSGSGECYCAKNDSCYALASIAGCCGGDRVVCY